jgi:hypothetical protein
MPALLPALPPLTCSSHSSSNSPSRFPHSLTLSLCESHSIASTRIRLNFNLNNN